MNDANSNDTNQLEGAQAENLDGSAQGASPALRAPEIANYREWRTADKSTWTRGDWDDEPDKVQWVDEATGFDCLIVRNHGGALCGYVGVPEGHPLYSVDYDTARRADGEWLEAHGGLTFAGFCSDNSREAWDRWRAKKPAWEAEANQYPVGDASKRLREWAGTFEDYDAWLALAQSRGVCHIPMAGRPDKVWWLGFDCAHAGDLCPGYDRGSLYIGDSYRDIPYVAREVKSLALQLASVAKPAEASEAEQSPSEVSQ